MFFIYIIGCLVFYIFLRAYLKIKLKFWYLQPVFHIYDVGLWLYPRGIIHPELPLVNKYTNLFNIKTYPLSKIEDSLLDRTCNFIADYYAQTAETNYCPTKSNIVDYLSCSNNEAYLSIYQKPKMFFPRNHQNGINHRTGINHETPVIAEEIAAVITARPLTITLGKQKPFQIYYVDNLCVRPDYRKKGLAPEMIQTLYYNLRQNNKKIQTCLFKREGELNAIVPLTTFTTYLYEILEIKQSATQIISKNYTNVIELGENQIAIFNDFMDSQKKQFSCIILPDLSNIMNLIKTGNIYLYGLLVNGALEGLYGFRQANVYFNKEEVLECFCSINANANSNANANANANSNAIFIQGFNDALQKLKEKINYKYILLEETSHNGIIVNAISLNAQKAQKTQKLLFQHSTAFFLYNYASYTVKSNKMLLFY